MTDELPALRTGKTDAATSLAKGIFGALPIVGPIAAEIIGNVIPNQRADRLVKFVELLEVRVKHLEQDTLRERCLQQDAVDLIEDAMFQAARAKSQERLEHIASIVSHGLTSDPIHDAEASKMLWLLERATDTEIIMLRGHLPEGQSQLAMDSDFQTQHEAVLEKPILSDRSTASERSLAALHDSNREHLVDMGLVSRRFRGPGSDGSPRIDQKTGMLAVTRYEITVLGKMFLRFLNLIPEWAADRQ